MSKPNAVCLNCASRNVARYCATCGQENRDTRRSLGQFGFDFFENYLSYDSKVWRTIVPLVIRPGFLTNEFNDGRRVRYFHPRKMYLFVSVVFFLLLSIFRDTHFLDVGRLLHRPIHTPDLVATATDVAETARDVSAEIESELRAGDKTLKKALGSTPRPMQGIAQPLTQPFIQPGLTYKKLGLRERIETRLQTLRKMDRTVLRERFAANMASHVPKMTFLLLPLFALLVMLFFRRPGSFYVEHLVFSFHAHTYFFVIGTVCLIWEKSTGNVRQASLGLLLTLPYIYASLLTAYRRGLLSTAVRFVALSSCYAFVLAIGVALLATFTLLLIAGT